MTIIERQWAIIEATIKMENLEYSIYSKDDENVEILEFISPDGAIRQWIYNKDKETIKLIKVS